MKDSSFHFTTLFRTSDKMHTRWFYMNVNCSTVSQSIYSVDIMQMRKRNASLVRRSVASSFNFSQAPGRRLRKERDCLPSGLKSLGSYYYTLLSTGFKSNCIPKNDTLSSGTYRYNPNKEVFPGGVVKWFRRQCHAGPAYEDKSAFVHRDR